MKEHPIIFSKDMVKAILDGRKTQTRRVITPQPFKGAWNATGEHPSYGWFCKKLYQTWDGKDDFFRRLVELCPYGQVGDRLWVRETWLTDSIYDDMKPSDVPDYAPVFFWADHIEPSKLAILGIKRPSIFMPRWASRITLEITEIRVEQLMKIDIRDIHAEGIHLPEGKVGYYGKLYVDAFHNLWDSLNAKRGYLWETNPWVWAITFHPKEQLEQEGR